MFTLGGWRAQVPKDRSDIAPGLGCWFDARLGYLDRFVSVLAMALDKSTGVDGQHMDSILYRISPTTCADLASFTLPARILPLTAAVRRVRSDG